MEDVNAEGVVKVNRYESLDEAMQEYLRLPNHQEKVLGIQNTETMQESMDFIRCENGIDQLTHAYEQIGGWLNPEIYEAVNKMEICWTGMRYRLHIRLETILYNPDC